MIPRALFRFRVLSPAWLLTTALTLRAEPPTITSPPRDQTVILYQPAQFSVTASGTPPLSYQWLKDGQPVAGATNDQLRLPQTQFSDSGRYSVIVSNSEGNITSTGANLTVNPPALGDLDYSFARGGSINGGISSVLVQPDGKVLIAGDFTTVHDAAREAIARFNPDGSTDFSFLMNKIPDYDYMQGHSMALQSDGQILFGFTAHYFDYHRGDDRGSLARLKPDGALDRDFQVEFTRRDVFGAHFGEVWSVVVQSDGKILVAGRFTHINGEPRNGFARLNADGTLDAGFLAGMEGGVYSIALQDGKVLIGGGFTNVNGQSRKGIARLNADGSLDQGFGNPLIRNSEYWVSSIVPTSDGKVLIAYGFYELYERRWVTRGNIARLNADGTLDNSFQNGLSGAVGDSRVISLALQSDGKVLIGRYFPQANAAERNSLARLNSDGSLDTTFHTTTSALWGPPDNSTYVSRIALQNDGKVLIFGRFDKVNGVPARSIARLWGSALPKAHLQSPGLIGEEFFFTLTAEPGIKYRIETSSDLIRWTTLGAETTGSGELMFRDPVPPNLNRRFYRALAR